MSGLGLDLRDALRSLRRDWSYALTVVLILGLTLGATDAVFSIVHGVLLRPLAYRHAQRLVVVRETVREVSHLYPSLAVLARLGCVRICRLLAG